MLLKKGQVKLRRAGVDKIYRKAGEQIPVWNLDEIQTGKNTQAAITLTEKDDKIELFIPDFL